VSGSWIGEGVALLYRDAAADRRRALELMVQAREWQRGRMPSLVPVTELLAARARARRGDRDAAIAVMRKALDGLDQEGRLGYGVFGTGALVETLLERGAESDLAEAQEAFDWLANLSADDGSAIREITLLRLRALLARARGDDVGYRDLASRYRAMAESLGFDGHIAWAEAMIERSGIVGDLTTPARVLALLASTSGISRSHLCTTAARPAEIAVVHYCAHHTAPKRRFP
jgi:hypothetical protein